MDTPACPPPEWNRFSQTHCPGGQRQGHAIGPYIVDFCAPRQKLIIELDGSQHLDQSEYDAERTAYLEQRGYQVLRFWNNQVMDDIEAVLSVILDIVNS